MLASGCYAPSIRTSAEPALGRAGSRLLPGVMSRKCGLRGRPRGFRVPFGTGPLRSEINVHFFYSPPDDSTCVSGLPLFIWKISRSVWLMFGNLISPLSLFFHIHYDCNCYQPSHCLIVWTAQLKVQGNDVTCQ